MDEPPSRLLKSRIPRKTIIFEANPRVDKNHTDEFSDSDDDSDDFSIYNPLCPFRKGIICPLRKGIICYRRNGTIFEHNIHSSRKHEPRIIVPKHPSRDLEKMSFVPIKGNRILLFAKYSGGKWTASERYLHLAIHEIRSDHRVGSALWSFDGSVDGRFDIRHLKLIRSTENELGITFWARFDDHWKLFDISTIETDTSNNFPLIESGRIHFDLKLKLEYDESLVILSPDTHILLNVDMTFRHNETIDIHYLDSGGTRFSFITRLSIPVVETNSSPEFAFSANGSKFAMSMGRGGVFVWDIRSKVPLRTFRESPWFHHISHRPRQFLQFSWGNLGKEILAVVEYNSFKFAIIRVINMMSLETEERLFLKNEGHALVKLFFDPHEGILYAELEGTIYEWDLRKKEPGPEWWIGEEQNVHLDKNTFHHQSTTGTKWLFTTSMVAIISCSCIISLLAFMIRTLAASM